MNTSSSKKKSSWRSSGKGISLVLLVLFLALPASSQTKLLPVPFICQAPYADWSQPWQDACEEAAILMVVKYHQGRPLDKAMGSKEIIDIVMFQIKRYGGHHDLDAKNIARLIKDYYGIKGVEVYYDIEDADIIREIDKGKPVIVPAAGRLLGNRYFTPPGPAYHNLVVIGYDPDRREFIANDPGTRRGKHFRYKYRVLMNAIHDWNGSKKTINSGRRAMIVVYSSPVMGVPTPKPNPDQKPFSPPGKPK